MRAAWHSRPIVTAENAAAAPAVTLAEVKAALRISHTDDDTYLNALIDVATARVFGWEGVARRPTTTQRFRIAVCSWDAWGRLFAPLAPCSGAVSIHYYAPDAVTLSEGTLSDFRFVSGPNCAYLEPLPGKAWPSIDDRPDALQAVFTCGYGDTADKIPATLRHALKLIIGHFYENREETTALKLARLPFGVDALVNQHRLEFYG